MDTTAPTTVTSLFTQQEWSRFIAAGFAWASEHDALFVLDEGLRPASERLWAAHVRDAMLTAGVVDLANRIDPAAFPEGAFEQIANLGRRHGRGHLD